MTHSVPSSAKMQTLLRDLETGPLCGYCPMKDQIHGQFCPMNRVFAYIRSLEADHKAMREALDKISDTCPDPYERGLASEALSSLQVHE